MNVLILRNTMIDCRPVSAGSIEPVTEKQARDLIAANKAEIAAVTAPPVETKNKRKPSTRKKVAK